MLRPSGKFHKAAQGPIVAKWPENVGARTAADNRNTGVENGAIPVDRSIAATRVESLVPPSKTPVTGAVLASDERILKSRGLVKVGVYYALPAETEIGNEVRETIPIFNLIESAFGAFQAILQQEAYVQSLDDQKIMLETRITDIQIELGRIAGSKLPEDQVLRANLKEELPTRKEQLSDTTGTLRMAVKRLVPPAKKQAVYDEFIKQRDAFLAATNELRPKVDKVLAQY